MFKNITYIFSTLSIIFILEYSHLSANTPFDFQVSTNLNTTVTNGVNLYPVSNTSGAPVSTQSSGLWTSGVGKTFTISYIPVLNRISYSFNGGTTVAQTGFFDGSADKLIASVQTNSDNSIGVNTVLTLNAVLTADNTTYTTQTISISGQNAFQSIVFPPSITGTWSISGTMIMSWLNSNPPAHNAAQFNIASLPALSTPEPATYLILGTFLALLFYAYPMNFKKRVVSIK